MGETKVMAKWGSLTEMEVERVVVTSEEGAQFTTRSKLGASWKEFGCFLHFCFQLKQIIPS